MNRISFCKQNPRACPTGSVWKRTVQGTMIVVTAAVIVADSWAGQPHQHDGGYFMRLSGGAGPSTTTTGDYDFSGAAGDINLAFGAIVAPNLAVHGTLFGWTLRDANESVLSTEVPQSMDLDLSAIGAGVTYYLDKSNAYFSGSVGLARISGKGTIPTAALDPALGFSADPLVETDGETDSGLAVDLSVGKEWWVSNRWGLGIAAGAGYHDIPGGLDGDHSGWNGALRFSATFN